MSRKWGESLWNWGRFLIPKYYLLWWYPLHPLSVYHPCGYPNIQTDPFSTGRARASQGIRERSRLHLLMLQKIWSCSSWGCRISPSLNIGFILYIPGGCLGYPSRVWTNHCEHLEIFLIDESVISMHFLLGEGKKMMTEYKIGQVDPASIDLVLGFNRS